jgi:glycosyltransferase involved in cell wall biosynthesis
MHIGLIAPPWLPVPPPGYGGTEVVIDNLARGLQALGHDVRLFTIGESTCPVPREYLYQDQIEPMGADLPEAAHALAAYEALAGLDIIHDHTVLGPLLACEHGIRRPPVVMTNHGLFTPQTRRIFAAVARHASIVAISHSQACSSAEVPLAARIELMRRAAALLNPITWREPFGLVMVEALASGTPVLAFPNGAAPEIVDPGRTGYLCRDEEEMITAVDRVPGIERHHCRAAAERRFSMNRMVLDYKQLYRHILFGQGQLAEGPRPA